MDLVSPRPFWPLKDGIPSNYPPLREDIHCDVVVLGAGISGALVARSLTRAGLNVVVIDRRDAAHGSTSASTALLQYEIDLPLTELTARMGRQDAERAYRLCHGSIDTIERLIHELGVDCVFQRKKSAYFASGNSEVKALQEECAARQAAGIAVEYWDEAAIASRFSFSRPGALISEQGAELDCYRLTFGLLDDAQALGARIFDRTRMDAIDCESAGVRLKTDRGNTIHARHAVFACGYESQAYLPKRVVKLKSTYALASDPIEQFSGWWEKCLIWETARPYVYLRTTTDGRAIIGGEDDPFRNPARRDRLVDKKTDRLAEKFRALFPDIELDVAFRWAGTFGETRDGLAYIGGVRQMPHCYFALGFGGNGITYSVIAADILRDLLLGRANDDARIFRFDR
jgi:glycine/D-amino acid oxidase-like deaminating enzyme